MAGGEAHSHVGKQKLINGTQLSYIISPPCVNTLLAVRAGLLKRILNMKLKAKYKWNNEEVQVKPVFFSWHVGLQYKTLTGYSAASIFCNKESEYVFPLQTKIVLFFVKIWYWMRFWLWMQIRYWQPNRIKRLLKKRSDDELPF